MDYIFEKDGRKRKARKLNCDQCKKEFLKRLDFIKNKNYCCATCSKQAQITKIESKCGYCNNIFYRKFSSKSKSGLFYCSRNCKDNAQKVSSNIVAAQLAHYGTGDKSKYREKAMAYYPHICEICKHDKYPELLQVHHIDSDRQNDNIDNLIILCAICHWAITLGVATMGKDRIWIYNKPK